MGIFDGWNSWLGSSSPQGGGWTAGVTPATTESGEFTPATQDAGWALQDHSRYGTIALEAEKNPVGVQENSITAGITKQFSGWFSDTPSTAHNYSLEKPADECAWYNIPCKTSKAVKATGAFIQSTLLKVILLVVIVAIVGIFIMSFAQAKGAQYA